MIFFIAHALCMGILRTHIWYESLHGVYIMLKYSHFTDTCVSGQINVYVIKVIATYRWPTIHLQVNHL